MTSTILNVSPKSYTIHWPPSADSDSYHVPVAEKSTARSGWVSVPPDAAVKGLDPPFSATFRSRSAMEHASVPSEFAFDR